MEERLSPPPVSYTHLGAHRFSIVTAGRSLKGEDLELALSAYRRLRRETGVKLCASHGLQTREEFERMKAAGVDRCHINLETSRRYFPHICTTHTYQDKVDNIRRAQAAGLEVCSGGILDVYKRQYLIPSRRGGCLPCAWVRRFGVRCAFLI